MKDLFCFNAAPRRRPRYSTSWPLLQVVAIIRRITASFSFVLKSDLVGFFPCFLLSPSSKDGMSYVVWWWCASIGALLAFLLLLLFLRAYYSREYFGGSLCLKQERRRSNFYFPMFSSSTLAPHAWLT